MLKKPADNSVELPRKQVDTKDTEHQYCEIAREVYQTIHTSGLDKFTFSRIDSWWNDLNAIVYELEHLPEAAFKERMEVIESLTEARNELRLARFLFNVEEINAVYRLIMRNRAVLRSEPILHRVLTLWALQPSPEDPE
jgi:hypothetical protein